jgi:phage-related minor tail protein
MLAGAVSDGIADAQENAKIQAQTASVLKSTGNAAGRTAEQIADYASSLSDAAGASLFGDDQIQQSENLLLTFTNIKGASLDAATAISVDMAQALGGAPKDSAIQLGKALNDPIKGITALTRVGVTFTDEQKAQIQAMQEAGDMAGAQGVILAELNKEFGGSAKAAADATGGWSEFNGRMGEAKEALGTALLPLLSQLAGVLLDTVLPVVEQAAAAFGPFVASLQPLIDRYRAADDRKHPRRVSGYLPARYLHGRFGGAL